MTVEEMMKIVDEAPTDCEKHPNIEDVEVEEWLATRKREALKIDPETAEVTWWYAQTLDPYGINPDLPEEYQQIGRESFARPPGSDIWVWFGDLPIQTQHRLEELHGWRLHLFVYLNEIVDSPRGGAADN